MRYGKKQTNENQIYIYKKTLLSIEKKKKILKPTVRRLKNNNNFQWQCKKKYFTAINIFLYLWKNYLTICKTWIPVIKNALIKNLILKFISHFKVHSLISNTNYFSSLFIPFGTVILP